MTLRPFFSLLAGLVLPPEKVRDLRCAVRSRIFQGVHIPAVHPPEEDLVLPGIQRCTPVPMDHLRQSECLRMRLLWIPQKPGRVQRSGRCHPGPQSLHLRPLHLKPCGLSEQPGILRLQTSGQLRHQPPSERRRVYCCHQSRRKAGIRGYPYGSGADRPRHPECK